MPRWHQLVYIGDVCLSCQCRWGWACPQYGVEVMMSEVVYGLLRASVQKRLRKLDRYVRVPSMRDAGSHRWLASWAAWLTISVAWWVGGWVSGRAWQGTRERV